MSGPGAWVVVASIPPMSSSIIQPNNVDRAQLGRDYDIEIQKRVQARIAAGKKVRFADVSHAAQAETRILEGIETMDRLIRHVAGQAGLSPRHGWAEVASADAP